jgi:Cu/Ag efflux pump CusA
MDYSKIAKFIIALLLLLALPIVGLGGLLYFSGGSFVMGCKLGIATDLGLITMVGVIALIHYIIEEFDR